MNSPWGLHQLCRATKYFQDSYQLPCNLVSDTPVESRSQDPEAWLQGRTYGPIVLAVRAKLHGRPFEEPSKVALSFEITTLLSEGWHQRETPGGSHRCNSTGQLHDTDKRLGCDVLVDGYCPSHRQQYILHCYRSALRIADDLGSIETYEGRRSTCTSSYLYESRPARCLS